MGRVATEEKKLKLREAVLSRRNALTYHDCLTWSRAIQTQALQLPAYSTAQSITLYSPSRNEVGTEEILRNSISGGRKIFYPRTDADGAGEFIRVESSDDLRIGRYGILEPSGAERLSVSNQKSLMIFVPGVAFDAVGNRLGRGNGWYDRALARLNDNAVLVGLAYDFQIVEEVPKEMWDRRVHYIVTETRLIDCGAASAPLRQVSQ
jgi:5-formyltetrahydrofolate cyclo-ligase